MGRPSIYTPELAEEICRRLAEGESLRRICASDGMPGFTTVMRWVVEDSHGFRAQYAHAREIQADGYADEMVDIADAAHDKDSAAASKVRMDARQWSAGKIAPKKYGQRNEHDVNVRGSLTHTIRADKLSNNELDALETLLTKIVDKEPDPAASG